MTNNYKMYKIGWYLEPVSTVNLYPQTAVRTWLPMRGPFVRWPHSTDAALAIFVFLGNYFITEEGQGLAIRAINDLPHTTTLLFALASGSLYRRRHLPLAVLVVSLSTLVFLTGFGYINSLWAVPFALYGVGRYVDNNRFSYIGVIATTAIASITAFLEKDPIGHIAFAFVLLFLVWYIGRYIRVRGDYLHLLEQRAVQHEREQVSEARRAVTDERTRIARELHDVVAHRVSLMTVQAGAAKTVAADDLRGALQAMEAVENAGRQALDELRHLMGVLRPESEGNALMPQPSIADIPRLIEEIRNAGLQVSLKISGEPSNLPARVALSAYRIVQESMTNVLKHAGPDASAEIRLSIEEHEVAIEVLDNGQGGASINSGHGIVGMRERAQLLGGRLDARPRELGGFQVVAHLPIGEKT